MVYFETYDCYENIKKNSGLKNHDTKNFSLQKENDCKV